MTQGQYLLNSRIVQVQSHPGSLFRVFHPEGHLSFEETDEAESAVATVCRGVESERELLASLDFARQ